MGLIVRNAAGLVLIAVIVLVSACDFDPETTTKITIVNYTDAPICYFNAIAEQAPENCGEIEPRGKETWRISCSSGQRVDTAGTTVVLTAGPRGREIYRRGARCTQWSDSGGQIVVDYTGSRFVVVDSLPDATPRP
jgi:hypothetical protein